jgi:SAM-dependent methyltransferase
MFSASEEFYDLIYSTFKDYDRETVQIAGLLQSINPDARSVLDVACGTGEHARRLAGRGFLVDGLDLDPRFLVIARRKHPAGRFFEADMSDFHLPHRYDAVLCLFSSIGYLLTLDRVVAALRTFRDHLAPAGVVVVEPWFPPGALDTSRVATHTGEGDGVRVTRTARVRVDGRISRLFFDYEITDAVGIRHATEVHEMGLFTTNELLDAFGQAGLRATHDPGGLMGDRGLFVATVNPTAQV